MNTNEILTKIDLEIQVEKIIGEIRKLKDDPSKKKQWLRSKEVQQMLGISASSLQNLRVNRVIPFSKIGGTIFYNIDDILKLLEDNRIEL